MRATSSNISLVKEHMSIEHNPLSTFSVILKEDRRGWELKEYSLYTLPKAVKKWMANREYEVWHEGTPFVTYVWK